MGNFCKCLKVMDLKSLKTTDLIVDKAYQLKEEKKFERRCFLPISRLTQPPVSIFIIGGWLPDVLIISIFNYHENNCIN